MNGNVVFLIALVAASIVGLIVIATRPVSAAWKRNFRIIAYGVLIFAGVRLIGRQFAVVYGSELRKGFMTLGRGSFRNPEMFRKVFAKPPLSTLETGARWFSIFGGGYGKRIEEFKTGTLYLSEQDSLPAAQRFSAPPPFLELHPDFSDHSDDGIVQAAVGLLSDFQTGL